MKSKKRFLRIILPILIALSVILIISFIVAFENCVFLFLSNYESNHIILKYVDFYDGKGENISGEICEISCDDYNSNYENMMTGLNPHGLIFPNTLSGGTVNYFCFKELHYGDEGEIYRSEIYLDWFCPSIESFEKENQRLLSIRSSINKPLLPSSNLFLKPSLIAEYNQKSGFEYVILDAQSLNIKYFYLKAVGSYSQIVFEDEYAPHKLLKDSDFPKDRIIWGEYSIYAYYFGEKEFD